MDKLQDTAAETVVGSSVKIQGDLNSEGNIRIEGQLNGKVKTTQNVHIGESAEVTADILAGNCTIAGSVQGNIKVTGSLVLQGTARVSGDINCAVLRVEDGALFSGKCSMGGEASGKGAKGSGLAQEPEPEE